MTDKAFIQRMQIYSAALADFHAAAPPRHIPGAHIATHEALDGMRSMAIYSPDERHRYVLVRRWQPGPLGLFIGMNPSTATEYQNDPTIERFFRRVLTWEVGGRAFGAIAVANVLAWRETDSTVLAGLEASGEDLIGPDNDAAIVALAQSADRVMVGWGRPGHANGRGEQVKGLMSAHGVGASCLGINRDGSPVHPLYKAYEAPLLPYGE